MNRRNILGRSVFRVSLIALATSGLSLPATAQSADTPYGTAKCSAYSDVESVKQLKVVWDFKGIVTERQYARHIALKGAVSSATSVFDIMETTILYVRPEQSVTECMAVMTNKRVRHLPVVDDGELVGIISIGDLVKSIIGDQKFTIDQLEHFLHGGH